MGASASVDSKGLALPRRNCAGLSGFCLHGMGGRGFGSKARASAQKRKTAAEAAVFQNSSQNE
jgi:hypothetical protein